ncbi:MAG: hypothetical protein AB1486_03315 [Planctomycetota bacterium]
MRIKNLAIAFAIIGLSSTALAQHVRTGNIEIVIWHGYEVVKDEALVQFKEGTPASVQTTLHQRLRIEVLEYTSEVLNLVRVPDGMALDDLIALYEAHAEVAFAQPNAIHRPLGVPNDPYYDSQWALPNINSSTGMGQLHRRRKRTGGHHRHGCALESHRSQ